MSASFYDLLKYAKTGIAAPDMTAYDKMRAVAMAGGKVKTLTGVPPLSFTGNGKPLISWSMLGNGRQNGTPAPDAPIMPEFVGERTENLSTQNYVHSGFNWSDGTIINVIATNRLTTVDFSDITSGQITAAVYDADNNSYDGVLLEYDSSCNYTGNYQQWYALPYTWTVGSNTKVRICVRRRNNSDIDDNTKIMINLGSTPLPYEPYGYKIPITNAGQTMPIYLGQTQTVRRIKKLVLTGEETGWADATFGGNHFFMSPVLSGGAAIYIGALSTHYMPSNVAGVQRPDNSIRQVVYETTHSQLSIRDDACATLPNFKTFLQQQYAAGTPVTVWYVLAEPETAIVNEPLAKIGDYADELHSTDAGVTIPTARGQNTLTVDTELQPSSMTITYRG